LFSTRIKSETQVSHRLLEETGAMKRLMSPSLTLQQYADLLTLWRSSWMPLEQVVMLHPVTTANATLRPAARVGLIDRDLDSLRAHGAQIAGAEFPNLRSHPLPPSGEGMRWFGLAYTLTGSLLGGAVIRKHLERQLGLSGGQGVAFFAGTGAAGSFHVGEWRQWLQTADQVLQDAQAQQSAINAANEAFAYLVACFSEDFNR
jgi:heme oxygenase